MRPRIDGERGAGVEALLRHPTCPTPGTCTVQSRARTAGRDRPARGDRIDAAAL